MTKRRLVLIMVASALLAFATACSAALDGGDGDGDTSGPNTDGQSQTTVDIEGGDNLALTNSESEEFGVAEFGSVADDAARVSAPGIGLPPSDPTGAQQLQSLLDRRIIQSTSIDVESEDISRHFQDIIRFADVAGGFVASSTFTNNDDGLAADITIKVPGTSYQSVLADIRGLGVPTRESTDSSDVTEEYTDLEARLRTLSATEQRYLELLLQADEIPEILLVQDRLDSVRGQIEQVQGRINLLESLTDLATITAHLRPPSDVVVTTAGGGGGLDPLDSAAAAWDTSLEALRNVAAVALVIVVFSWWILPPLAVVALGARWWNARRPHGTVVDPQAS